MRNSCQQQRKEILTEKKHKNKNGKIKTDILSFLICKIAKIKQFINIKET